MVQPMTIPPISFSFISSSVIVQTPAADPRCRAEFIRPSANKFAPAYWGEQTVTSAVGYYRQVLQQEPGNQAAEKGLGEIINRYVKLAESAIETPSDHPPAPDETGLFYSNLKVFFQIPKQGVIVSRALSSLIANGWGFLALYPSWLASRVPRKLMQTRVARRLVDQQHRQRPRRQPQQEQPRQPEQQQGFSVVVVCPHFFRLC
jgi:hypothetical protein